MDESRCLQVVVVEEEEEGEQCDPTTLFQGGGFSVKFAVCFFFLTSRQCVAAEDGQCEQSGGFGKSEPVK